MKRVVITGLGIVCPLGSKVKTVWPSVVAGEVNVVHLTSQYDALPCRIASVVNEDIYAQIISQSIKPCEKKTMSRTSVMLMHAAKDALEDAGLEEMTAEDQLRSGVSIGIGFDGVLESMEANKFNKSILSYNSVGPYALTKSLGNMPGAHISIRYKLKGPSKSVNTACAAGLNAIGDAFKTVLHGEADVMIGGGVEASISPWSIAAFSRIRALPTTFNDNPNNASRPFDLERAGFLMSEGAGAVILESLEHALQRGKQPLVEVVGFGQSCDTLSLVAPDTSGDGAYRAMALALQSAGLNPSQIGYVNAHATSTPQGDLIECKAIEQLFGVDVPVSSFKGSLGHCLGGSGAVETVLTIQSILDNELAANTNLCDPDPLIKVNLIRTGERLLKWYTSPRIAVKNSFGFGGTNCSLVLKQFMS